LFSCSKCRFGVIAYDWSMRGNIGLVYEIIRLHNNHKNNQIIVI